MSAGSSPTMCTKESPTRDSHMGEGTAHCNFNPKIALLGCGQIGGTIALLSGLKKLSSNIVVLDVIEGMPFGKCLDLNHAFSCENIACQVEASNDLSEGSVGLAGSDIVIVTAGYPRKPGMSRNDLLQKNSEVISSIGKSIGKLCPNAFVVCITNPLDVMVSLLQKSSGLPTNKVVGMAGQLDTSRFKFFLSQKLNVSVQDISTMVLGGHGDDMVPLKNYTTVSGIPLATLVEMKMITEEEINEIIEKTKTAGGDIVKLLKIGSAFIAPACSAIAMIESYLRDEKRIIPCCAFLSGEYGYKDVYGGVPCLIGKNGVEKIFQLPLNAQEKTLFQNSMNSVLELKSICNSLGFSC